MEEARWKKGVLYFFSGPGSKGVPVGVVPTTIIDVRAIVLSEPAESLARDSWDGTQDDAVIEVHTDGGLIGIGEVDSSPQLVRAAVEAVGSHNAAWGLRELAIGQDALAIGPLWERMYRGSIYYGREGVGASAMGGVEMALWDIFGQVTGLPLHVLLGGPFRDEATAYASVLTRDTAEENVELVTRLAQQGYTAFKLGGGVLGQDAVHDESIVAAVRDAAPQAQLMIDLAYEWHDPWTALRRARALERYELGWIEEPLPPDDLDAYEWLAARSPIPIAAGEAETSEAGLIRLLEMQAVHVVQPDITRCGGFGVTCRVARAAAQRGVRCVPHVWKTGINKAAALQIAGAMQHVDLIECCVEPNPLQESLTVEHFEPKEGRIAIPRVPGLGATLDPDTVARYRSTD